MDKDLALMLQDDDMNAFDALYQKYHQAIYKNIFKLIKEDGASQDILQDVFLALWENRKQIDESQSIGGWLFTVSFNKSLNHLQKITKEKSLAQLYPSIEQDLEEDDELFENHSHTLRRAVAQLSPQKQKVLTLCKIEGKTYQEAADELSISKYTVKEYLSISLFNLKSYFRSLEK